LIWIGRWRLAAADQGSSLATLSVALAAARVGAGEAAEKRRNQRRRRD